MNTPWKMLVLLCLTELLAMTVWFSASAVGPALQIVWELSESELGLLVIAVQCGFVVGTLFIAVTNLADILNARHVVAVAAILAAIVNAGFVWLGDDFKVGLILRFLTGLSLAGVYPPGMKIMAGWFKTGRGLAIGALVGALTIGSAAPHLIGTFLREQWQQTIFVSSGLSLVAAGIVFYFVKDGPYTVPARKFNFKYAAKIFRDRPTRLAYFGYFGHMWELYAMWTWVPVYLFTMLDAAPDHTKFSAGFGAFLVIAVGAIGCLSYGFWADKIGRSIATMTAMAVSGFCCFAVGFLQTLEPIWVLIFCLIWGVTVVADSAQFSAAATELCEPEYMGTVLTLQTSIGFLITMFSIHFVPLLKNIGGWGLAFSSLGVGPLFGIFAMGRLYRLPEAVKMANGNR